jgi:hypothetical protein
MRSKAQESMADPGFAASPVDTLIEFSDHDVPATGASGFMSDSVRKRFRISRSPVLSRPSIIAGQSKGDVPEPHFAVSEVDKRSLLTLWGMTFCSLRSIIPLWGAI